MVRSSLVMGSKREQSAVPGTAQAPAGALANTTSHIPIRPAASGPIITHFQPSNKGQNNTVIYEEFLTDEYCVDRESVRRKFGWGAIGEKHHMPYIFRNGDKYCSVRMVDKYIFDNYLTKISDNIYLGCTNILGYYLTVPESLLLNEINEFHCDNYFGNVGFKQGDVLVKLEDANRFYEFLSTCSNKLLNTPCDEKRCGFLTMNEKSMVPYVCMNEQKFVPLFYFDGMEGIKFKVQKLKGWYLSYLKFCFKVHGIRDEFCKNDECSVIALDELITYLDPSDVFKEWWPVVVPNNKVLFQPKKLSKMLVKPWHQHPITVLPVSTVKYTKVVPNNKNGTATTPAPNGSVYYRTISHS